MALRKEREDLASKAAEATRKSAELDVKVAESSKRIADLDHELASAIKKVSDLDGKLAVERWTLFGRSKGRRLLAASCSLTSEQSFVPSRLDLW